MLLHLSINILISPINIVSQQELIWRSIFIGHNPGFHNRETTLPGTSSKTIAYSFGVTGIMNLRNSGYVKSKPCSLSNWLTLRIPLSYHVWLKIDFFCTRYLCSSIWSIDAVKNCVCILIAKPSAYESLPI